MSSLKRSEIYSVVESYIGVSGGYLGDFSYRTHREFYPHYCDLEIYPDEYEGTTRERFIKILETQPIENQVKILRGVLDRFPERTDGKKQILLNLISRLESLIHPGKVLHVPRIEDTTEVVKRALKDAGQLPDPFSRIDRIHTALHGHLIFLCKNEGIVPNPQATITAIYGLLRQHHPALKSLGSRDKDMNDIINGLAKCLDALNNLRNNSSLAHPNELLESAEADLAVNAANTFFHYINAKLNG